MKILCALFLIFGVLNLLGKEKKVIQKDLILKTFKQKSEREAVRACYEEALKVNPELEGRVLVNFEIGSDGSVQEVKIESTTMNNQNDRKLFD